jgi:hypothetical protein
VKGNKRLSRETHHRGEIVGGTLVQPGDALVRYGDGVIVDVVAFHGKLGRYREVTLRSRTTGRTGRRGADQLRKAFWRCPEPYASDKSYTHFE